MAESLDAPEGAPVSLKSQVLARLREAIVSGRYQPGEVLLAARVAEELGVSRTPVREALQALEAEGLVRTLPNRGVVVEGITPSEVDDIFTIRSVLEALAARWAAQHMTDQELAELGEIVDLMEFYTARQDVEQVTRLDARFHQLIVNASRSRPLKLALGGAVYYVQQARAASLRVPGRLQRALEEHRQVYRALAARDAEGAARAISAHIEHARANVLGGRPGY
ncbi:MAG: GntR family transcriptional regulator [Firmicutes bacterium]|nr:GntR family transcriptional regulator [Bacillota bacterium]